MNKRGFTLVELLAVIVILALLALLTSTAVTKIVKDSKENLSSVQIQNIKEAAEMWGADNLDKLPDAGDCNYITLGVLQDEGLIKRAKALFNFKHMLITMYVSSNFHTLNIKKY